jgi:hypothetical protein
LPLCFCLLAVIVVILIRSAKIVLSASAVWPESGNPGLALQLASSPREADGVLGMRASDHGTSNRRQMERQQLLDFGLIGCYVAFFSAVPLSVPSAQRYPFFGFAACVAGVLAGLFGTFANLNIIQLCDNGQGSPKPFAQAKWVCFFAALTLATGSLVFADIPALSTRVVTGVVGAVALGLSLGGIVAASHARFANLAFWVRFAWWVIAVVAVLPLMINYGISFAQLLEYLILLRVPLATGIILLTLPWIANWAGARALLLGLFDVATPRSGFFVALGMTCLAAIASGNARVIYLHAASRFNLLSGPPDSDWVWPGLTALLSLPSISFMIWYSSRQNKTDDIALRKRIGWAAAALALTLGVQGLALAAVEQRSYINQWQPRLLPGALSNGYFPRFGDHLSALLFFIFALLVYIAIGFYGYKNLGKATEVPALCSALLLMMLVSFSLSALSFFFDLWHVPLLLLLAVAGYITARSPSSDHLYNLLPSPAGQRQPAPTPLETVSASRSRRLVVVAANGGGIQAAAWTAQVLEGLDDLDEKFADSLRLISAVSGGSHGSTCYVYCRAQKQTFPSPADAAKRSSLDELAWGLGWPDFIRALFPWFSANLIGRGRALEKAWVMNCSAGENDPGKLDEALSNWNDHVRNGDLPGLILNATLVESGERLLFGTTRFSGEGAVRARVDATELHGSEWDVSAVSAARLSASFPYVTPASRSDLNGPRPHVVDGGYYDNYGMATLVEWLDEALSEDAKRARDQRAVGSVLVVQIHGSPVGPPGGTAGSVRNRGWFFQLLAPLLTLNSVRGSGQIAHNDIELRQLQDRWFEVGVPIHSVTFECPDNNAPLSWHLTRAQRDGIRRFWEQSGDLDRYREQVKQFLAGNDFIECHCPTCNVRQDLLPAVRAAAL